MQSTVFSRLALSESLALSFSKNTLHKTNYLTLFFRLPLSDETASEASLLAHLITNLSADYPSMYDLRRAKAALWGAEIAASTSALGDTLLLTVNATYLKDRYAPKGENITAGVLSFLRSFFCRPYLVDGTFDPALVRLEAKNAADDARAVLNDKSRLARRRHVEIMYEGTPFAASSLGRAELIESLTADKLTESFYRLLSSAPVEAIFVGETDEELLAQELSRLMGEFQKTPLTIPAPTVGTAPETVRCVTEYMDINQAHLCLGLRSPSLRTAPDYFAFSVANTVFGAGTTSKLFMNVREKLSLCYRVASIYSAQNGFLQIYAGIDADKRSAAEDEILLQLANTQNGEIGDDEFQNAKNTLTNAIRTYTESPDSLAAWAIPRILMGVKVDPAYEIERLSAVGKDEAAESFRRLVPDTFYCLQKEEL